MNPELFIFHMWCCYRGSIMVVSDTEENARIEMRKSDINYEENLPVEKHEIKAGLMISDSGDA